MNLNATLIIEVLSFLIFMGVLTKLLYKPLLKMMDTRREEIKKLKEQTEDFNQKAQGLKEETEKILQKTKQEILKIREDALREASQERLQLQKDAKVESQRIIEHGRLEVFREAEKAKDRIKEDIVDLSIAMAQKILTKEIDKDTQKKLVAKSIDKLSHGE